MLLALALSASTLLLEPFGEPPPLWLWGAPVIALLGVFLLPIWSRGESMLPTLPTTSFGLGGFVPPLHPQRGGLVLAVAPGIPTPVVKRVVALGGDQVVSTWQGVTVNGRPPVGARLAADTGRLDLRTGLSWTVPERHVFLLGDQIGSIDSRAFGPIPLSQVLAVYWPLGGFGRGTQVAITGEDAADIERIRAGGGEVVPVLERVLASPAVPPDHLAVVLRWGLRELGDRDRELALVRRTFDGSTVPANRLLFGTLLATLLFEAGRIGETLEVTTRLDRLGEGESHRSACTLHATSLARLGRYEAALDEVRRLRERWPTDAHGAELASLVGLGRLDEAEQRIRQIGDSESWGGVCWELWYRGYVAVARGRTEEGAALLVRALRADFPAPELARTAPQLEPLRRDPAWSMVEAALAERSA